MPGSKFLSLVVFVVTIGWAVWGQNVFGHDDIQKIVEVIISNSNSK